MSFNFLEKDKEKTMGKRCDDCGAELHQHQDGEHVWFSCVHCTKIFGAELDLKTLEYVPTISCIKRMRAAQIY